MKTKHWIETVKLPVKAIHVRKFFMGWQDPKMSLERREVIVSAHDKHSALVRLSGCTRFAVPLADLEQKA